MSRGEKWRRRLRRMRKNHPGTYLKRAWRWAAKAGEYKDNKRWGFLAGWAANHRQYSWKRSYKAKRHKERLEKLYNDPKRGSKSWRAIRRAGLAVRKWADKGRHFAHIEKLYRQEKRRLKKRLADGPPGALVKFDGKTAAGWIVREVLIPARRSGQWTGYLISGYRTPEYSESLCYAMCGRPSCPGQCAGRASNHAKHIKPDGAVDVSDSQGLSNWEAQHGYPIRHTLQYDLPHHSRTGQ